MKTALVIGMGISGVASARLLHREGYRVVINDTRKDIPGLEDSLLGVAYEAQLGVTPSLLLEGVDLMVLSPGVPMYLPFIAQARAQGVEVIGEIELGARYTQGKLICITGTNGKTTCTALTGEICKAAGHNTSVLGNIGTPLTAFSPDGKETDLIVVETAALQLEGNSRFHAHVAAVSNISEDHMDRFGNMAYYVEVKSKIFLNQTQADFAVLNYDDPLVRGMRKLTPAQVFYFSRREEVEQGVFLRGGDVWARVGGEQSCLLPAADIRIPGVHNLENAMLCAAIGISQGIEGACIAAVLRSFAGVEHRIEYVCERAGVWYYNDSKGTNPDSTIKAIQAMSRPTVLLLGGFDKHSTFDKLFRVIKKSPVKAVVLLGETAEKLMQYAKEAGVKQVTLVQGNFQKAVDTARDLAVPGDTVLLSPACASWDMFENFEQRGDAFKQIVRAYEA